MLFIEFLISISILCVFFKFIDFVIACIVAIAQSILKLDKLGTFISKSISLYIFVSLISCLTSTTIYNFESFSMKSLYMIIGLFSVYVNIGSSMYEKKKNASATNDFEILESSKYDVIFLILSLVYFIISLVIPKLAFNNFITDTLIFIGKIYNIKILGTIIAILSGLYFLKLVVYGILFISVLTLKGCSSISNKFKWNYILKGVLVTLLLISQLYLFYQNNLLKNTVATYSTEIEKLKSSNSQLRDEYLRVTNIGSDLSKANSQFIGAIHSISKDIKNIAGELNLPWYKYGNYDIP